MARGHRLNTSIILAAVHGLSGLFRAYPRSSLHSFVPFPPVPVPNKPPRFCGRKAKWSLRPPWLYRVQDLCESRGGLPGLPVPNKPTVSVDVKQHFNNNNPPWLRDRCHGSQSARRYYIKQSTRIHTGSALSPSVCTASTTSQLLSRPGIHGPAIGV